MRFRSFALLAILPGCVTCVALGCGSDDANDPGTFAAFDGSTTGPTSDSGAPSSIDAGTAAPTLFRFAHLSNGLGPLDVCYRVGTTDAFTGPIFAPILAEIDSGKSVQDASFAAGDASTPSRIAFPGVSPYFSAPAAADFEVAIVDAASGSCSTPAARARITLDPGRKLTIALIGSSEADLDASNALQIVSFVDDDDVIEDAGRSRFIHAALGGHGGNSYGPLSVSAQLAMMMPLAGHVDPKGAATSSSTPPTVDLLGYHTSDPIGEGSLRIQEISDAAVESAAWISTPTLLALSAGSVRTGFIVSDKNGIAVLWCDDEAVTASCMILR